MGTRKWACTTAKYRPFGSVYLFLLRSTGSKFPTCFLWSLQLLQNLPSFWWLLHFCNHQLLNSTIVSASVENQIESTSSTSDITCTIVGDWELSLTKELQRTVINTRSLAWM